MFDIKETLEYKKSRDYLSTRYAERSGVSYFNHIIEGLIILEKLHTRPVAMRAFCLHPIFQSDEDLFYNSSETYKYTEDPEVALLVAEYRSVANEYLSSNVLKNPSDIRLSPITAVNDMLIADKVQNYKDFLIYHVDSHPGSKELSMYFRKWLTRLGVTREQTTSFFERLGESELLLKDPMIYKSSYYWH